MTTHSLRTLLAHRLRELMDSTPALDTQTKIAERSGIAQSTVGRILRGDVAVTLDNVEALARAFDIGPHELLQKTRSTNSLDLMLVNLPADEIEKILAYARFVQMQFAEQKTTYSVERETPMVEGRGKLKPGGKQPVFTTETTATTGHAHDQQGTKRKLGGANASRSIKRSRGIDC